MNFFRFFCFLVLLGVSTASADTIRPDLQRVLNNAQPNDIISALVYLPVQVDLAALDTQLDVQKSTLRARHSTVVRTLQQTAQQTQGPLLNHLAKLKAQGKIQDFTQLWLVNAVIVKANRNAIRQLAQRVDVKTMYLDYDIELIRPVPNPAIVPGGVGGAGTGGAEPGLIAIRAPEVWALGITGDGILVSSLDTGVQGSHPALSSRWAGTADPIYSGHPEWAWFDPVTNTNSPQSFGGHGTHTMGTICGGAPGQQVGVAPGAHWIHAAVIDRVNIARTISDSILAFQWIVDPDGDPETNFDVPCVCSNSWGLVTGHGVPPCDQTFWNFLDACEAAGTVIVFAAGNEGNQGLRRPGDRATTDYKTFAVAAVNGNINGWPIASFSSRGPTFCTPNGGAAIKPDIAAPGVSVRSAWPNNTYINLDGTSMATPHIAGVVALIRQANPNLAVDEIKQIIYDTAFDLGTTGQDNSYGWGMVDAYEAVQLALSMNNSQSFPSSFQVTVGNLISGDLQDLLISDNQYVRVSNTPAPSPISNSVEIEVTGTVTDQTPAELTLTLEAGTNGVPTQQRVQLRNYDNGTWDLVDVRNGPTSDTEIMVTISSNAGRYIQDGTGQVKARLGYRDLGAQQVGWNGRFDLVYWTTN